VPGPTWWRSSPGELGRVEDRLSTVYVSHARLDRADNAVTIVRETGTVHLPTAMLAAVLLGPGTSITHPAVVLLADSGTSVVWVGEQGVRMYASGSASSRTARLLLRQAWLVSSPQRRLSVARRMYDRRFPEEDTSRLTMQQLRGREGARVRACYREHALRTGVPWTRREYTAGQAFGAGDDVNRMLSAANASLYGVVHSAVAALGCSPRARLRPHRARTRLRARHGRRVQGVRDDPRRLRRRRSREVQRVVPSRGGAAGRPARSPRLRGGGPKPAIWPRSPSRTVLPAYARVVR